MLSLYQNEAIIHLMAVPVPPDCGTRAGKRIANGVLSQQGQWPWIVHLIIASGFQCGGSLIHPQWILTAAHCVEIK